MTHAPLHTPPVLPTPARLPRHAALGVALGGGLLLTGLAATRSFYTFGVESDYLGRFVPDAQLVLEGFVPEGSVHPPLYATLLAGVTCVLGDWLRAGLTVSVAFSVLTLVCATRVFARLAGPAAQWGALVGLLTSGCFVVAATQAASDAMFAGLFWATLWCTVEAGERQLRGGWLAAGVLAGLGVLTRGNGVTLLAVAAAPWVWTRAPGVALPAMTAVLAGLALPLGLWAGIALVADVEILPSGNVANVAMTFFPAPGTRPFSTEAYLAAEARFASLLQVLTHDPATLGVRYVRGLLRALGSSLSSGVLLCSPLAYLAWPGLLLLPATTRGPGRVLLGILLGLQLLCVGLVAYDPRFHLFLVPVLGAAAGAFLAFLHRHAGSHPAARRGAAVGAAIGAALLLLGATQTLRQATRELHAQDVELGQVTADAAVGPHMGGRMVARKPHVPFLTGSTWILLPQVTSASELRTALQAEASAEPGPLWLYFGSVEATFRPELAPALLAGPEPDWLEPLARGDGEPPWRLYRVR